MQSLSRSFIQPYYALNLDRARQQAEERHAARKLEAESRFQSTMATAERIHAGERYDAKVQDASIARSATIAASDAQRQKDLAEIAAVEREAGTFSLQKAATAYLHDLGLRGGVVVIRA
jgi:hypothetical protein